MDAMFSLSCCGLGRCEVCLKIAWPWWRNSRATAVGCPRGNPKVSDPALDSDVSPWPFQITTHAGARQQKRPQRSSSNSYTEILRVSPIELDCVQQTWTLFGHVPETTCVGVGAAPERSRLAVAGVEPVLYRQQCLPTFPLQRRGLLHFSTCLQVFFWKPCRTKRER